MRTYSWMARPPGLSHRLAKLELNARGHHYADQLDRCADLMVTDHGAFTRLPVVLQERARIYADFRAADRSAVSEGAVADDRGPGSQTETSTW